MSFRFLAVCSLFIAALAALSFPWSCSSNNGNPTAPAPTATPVFTDTPCLVGGTPCTSTATPTSTNTGTPTFSPTPTPTLCATQTPTWTPSANGNSFSGTINFTGATVNASHPLGVVAVNIGGGGEPAFRFLTSNGGSYSIDGLSSGATYILSFWYNAKGDGTAYPQPHIGDYVTAYGSLSCAVSTWTFVTAGGAQTGLNANFNTSRQLYGVAGTAAYSGSLGNVDGCYSLVVQLWPTGTGLYGASGSVTCGSCTPITSRALNTNGAYYGMVDIGINTNICTSQMVDVLAFYQKPGTSCCGIQPGDPYVFLTNVNTANSASRNINISDSLLY